MPDTLTSSDAAPFRVGQFQVDPGLNTVSGPAGAKQIEPKAMQVLCVLYQHAGETVSREDLLGQVWSGRVVVEETLTRTISQLRQAFGEGAKQRDYIQTVPKRGYRLVAPIDESAASSEAAVPLDLESTGQSRPFRRIIASGFLVILVMGLAIFLLREPPESRPQLTAGPPSMAVLPFKHLDGNPESAYLAEGVAEELLNALASVPELRVPPRHSSFAYRERELSLKEIAGELDVRHVLEGSVRRSGDQVRINARLVEVATDSTLWSRQYDGDLQRIFEVQEEIAAGVIGALQDLLLGPAPPASVTRSDSVDAYSLYLQGNYYWMNGTTSNWFYQARDAFEGAISLDPEFAAAHASLAYIYARHDFHDQYMPKDLALEGAENAIRQALKFDDQAVDAYHARAILATSRGDYSAAIMALERALQIRPRNAVAYNLLSELHTARNEPDLALAAAEQALAIDPLSPWVNVNKGIVHFHRGELDVAGQSMADAIRIDPDYTWAYVWQAMVYHGQGRLADAIISMQQCLALDPSSESNAALMGLLYLDVQDVAQAGDWFEQAASLQGDGNSPRLWGRMVSLVFDRDDDGILLALGESQPGLNNSRFSLLPSLFSAHIRQGQKDQARQLVLKVSPGLSADPPQVRPSSLQAAVLLAALGADSGSDNTALVGAIRESAEAFPGMAQRLAIPAQLLLINGRQDQAIEWLHDSLDRGWIVNAWMLLQLPMFEAVADSEDFKRFQQRVIERRQAQAAVLARQVRNDSL